MSTETDEAAETELRDRFAMSAIKGLAAKGLEPTNIRSAAEMAYYIADAMIEARRVRAEPPLTGKNAEKINPTL